MSKYYIPTINQLMSNQTGFVQTYFEPSGIKYIWNKKYDFEYFKRIGTNISILTATVIKSYSDDTRITYTVECTDTERFADNLHLGIKEIALSKIKLRDKIVNSDRWTFLTYMTYDNKEKRIPRNEKFEAEISK